MPGYLVTYSGSVPGADSIVTALRGIGLWPAAHFFVLLLGMYLLVLYLTRTKLPGVVAAVGFGLSTYLPIILTAGHNTKFVALAFAPWLLLAFAALIRREPGTKRMKSGFLTLLFAIAAATNLRAGHVQITYYIVVIAAIWWIAEGVTAFRSGTIKTFGFSTGLLVIGSVLGLALVAHPYLMQLEFKAFTTRGAAAVGGGMAWDYAMEWSQGWGELLTLVIPNAYGGGGQLYWGPKVFTAGPHYLGPVVLLLALVGAVGVARRSVIAFTVAAVLMTGFALGDHFGALNHLAFAALPLFDTFRVPETWLAAVALVLALLAGWGAYYLQRREATPEAEARKQRVAYGAIAVFVILVGGLWITGGAGLAFEKDGEAALATEQLQAQAAQAGLPPTDPQVGQAVTQYLTQARADRQAAFSHDAGRSLLFLLLAAICVYVLATRRTPAFVALGALALLATADLWGVGRRFVSEDSPSIQRARDPVAMLKSQETEADRFLAERAKEAGPGSWRVLPQNTLSAGLPSYYAESVGGYNGVRLANFQDYLDNTLPDSTTGYNRNALRLLAVRYVVAQGDGAGPEAALCRIRRRAWSSRRTAPRRRAPTSSTRSPWSPTPSSAARSSEARRQTSSASPSSPRTFRARRPPRSRAPARTRRVRRFASAASRPTRSSGRSARTARAFSSRARSTTLPAGRQRSTASGRRSSRSTG